MTDSGRKYSAARVNPKHLQPARRVDMPEPGFFRLRYSAKHPWMAARITYGPPIDPETGAPQVERSFLWCGEINGEMDPNPTPDPSEMVMRIWLGSERITEAEYRYMTETAKWDRAYAPSSPTANPTKRIDLRELDPSTLL
jgi:hypothetical protein